MLLNCLFVISVCVKIVLLSIQAISRMEERRDSCGGILHNIVVSVGVGDSEGDCGKGKIEELMVRGETSGEVKGLS